MLIKMLIVRMGFPRLGAAMFTQTAQECTSSKLNNVRHA
jgi:hypothetical protein